MTASGQRLRVTVLAVLLGLAGIFAIAYSVTASTFDAAGEWRVWLFLAMAMTGLGAVFCWPDLNRKTEVGLLLGVSLLLRLFLLPAAPSDDIHRYLWEGKLVAAGVSPYQAVADDPVFTGDRDEQWASMNHRDRLTAYPPGAMLIFALLGKVSYSPVFFKVVFVLLDWAVVAILIAVLTRRGLPLRWAGFYAFNPVILISFAAEGHFDILMVAALVGAIWASDARRPGLAAGLLGVAVAMKIIVVLALPFFLRRLGWRYGVPFTLALLTVSLPFLDDFGALFRGLLLFGSEGNFNGLPYIALLDWMGSRKAAILVVTGAFFAICAWRFFRMTRGTRWEDDLFFVGGALLVLSPTLHFWYLSWLLPLLALRPSVAWLTFSVTQAFYFLVWSNAKTGAWGLTTTQMLLIWIPFLLLGAYEWTHFHRRKTLPLSEWPDGLSVVIPALNAADCLPACLVSIRNSRVAPHEIVVADGGSCDATRAIAESARCTVVTSPPGRGDQIAAGVKRARFRYILVLHADCELAPDSIGRLRGFLNRSPDVVGGALGQRFKEGSATLLFIEVLNEIRSTLGSVSFGDQGQFFDRRYLRDADFPAQPLMEDVELSLRLRERGRCVYLGCELRSESAKWQAIGSWCRVLLVMRFVVTYRWARMRSRPRALELSRQLYREYYRS